MNQLDMTVIDFANFNKSILSYKPNLNKTIFDLASNNESYKWLKKFFKTKK